MVSEIRNEDSQDKKIEEIELISDEGWWLININISINSLKSQNEAEVIVTEGERNNTSMIQVKYEVAWFWWSKEIEGQGSTTNDDYGDMIVLKT